MTKDEYYKKIKRDINIYLFNNGYFYTQIDKRAYVHRPSTEFVPYYTVKYIKSLPINYKIEVDETKNYYTINIY